MPETEIVRLILPVATRRNNFANDLSHSPAMSRGDGRNGGGGVPLRQCAEFIALNSPLIEGPELSLCCCHRCVGSVPEHLHDQLEISFLSEPACCVFGWRGKRGVLEEITLRGPAVIMIAPRQLHSCVWNREADAIAIYLEKPLYADLLPDGVSGAVVPVPAAGQDLPLWQVANGLRGMTPSEHHYTRMSLAIGLALAMHVTDLHGRTAASPIRRLTDALLDKAKAFVEANLAANICTDDIANHVGYSVTHFSTLFKAATGITPSDYLFRRRMEKARELLRTGNFKIGEVAQKVNYVDRSNFTEVFREYHGVSPKQVIEQAKLESANRPKI